MAGVSAFGESPTAKLLPPEFYAFGISQENWRPWSPVDTLCICKTMNFALSWNFMHDLTRESLRRQHPDLNELAEEIAPFYKETMAAHTYIIDEDDLKEWGHWSDVSLTERYHAAKDEIRSASPKFTHQKSTDTQKREDPLKKAGLDEPIFG